MKRPSIAIVDYGIGNLRSAEKAVQRAGGDGFLATEPSQIEQADGVVLPGVGAMGSCMDALERSGLRSVTLDAVGSGRPFLGVCVGMQMLHRGSDEDGGVEGLGIFAGQVKRIDPDPEEHLKVPQVQWNIVAPVAGRPSLLLGSAPVPFWAYFVHSYAAELHDEVVGTCAYGGAVTAVVERGNVGATQFHPEKSGPHGIALLEGFVQRCSAAA